MIKKHNMCRMRRKGVQQFLAWVLLLMFAVILASIVAVWMRGFAEDKTADVKESLITSDECSSVSISIDSACRNASAPQHLYINLTNRKELRIDKVVIQLYNITQGSIVSSESISTDIILKPGMQKELSINAASSDINRLEVVPVRVQKGIEMHCSEGRAEAQVSQC